MKKDILSQLKGRQCEITTIPTDEEKLRLVDKWTFAGLLDGLEISDKTKLAMMLELTSMSLIECIKIEEEIGSEVDIDQSAAIVFPMIVRTFHSMNDYGLKIEHKE